MRGKGVPFVLGDKRAGRPKGRKNKAPGSIRAALVQLAAEEPELLARAIRKGLAGNPAKAFPFVQLAAYYLDGKPVQRLQVDQQSRMLFLPGGSRPDLGASLDDPDTIDE
jgi:hypothetical protein